jgi:vesicle coat complex subunit
VRKTAAVSVAKLHDINSSLVEEQGFLDSLKVGRFNSPPVKNSSMRTLARDLERKEHLFCVLFYKVSFN